MKQGAIVVHRKTGTRWRCVSVHHNYRNYQPEPFLSVTVTAIVDNRKHIGGGPASLFVVDEDPDAGNDPRLQHVSNALVDIVHLDDFVE